MADWKLQGHASAAEPAIITEISIFKCVDRKKEEDYVDRA